LLRRFSGSEVKGQGRDQTECNQGGGIHFDGIYGVASRLETHLCVFFNFNHEDTAVSSAVVLKNTYRLNSPLYVQQSRLEFSLMEAYQGNPGNNTTRAAHNVYGGGSVLSPLVPWTYDSALKLCGM